MDEPKLHGIPNAKLPDDHYLNDGELLTCEQCSRDIYTPEEGTVRTWVETGMYIDMPDPDDEDDGYFVICLRCFAQAEDSYPAMNLTYAFNSGKWDPPDGRYIAGRPHGH